MLTENAQERRTRMAATDVRVKADANTAKIINYDREVPEYTRWQLGVQQHIGAGWVAELNYVGSQGSNLPVRRDLNYLPAEYVSFDRSRDADQEAYLTQSVPNPYKGLLPGTTINGSTVQRRQLLQPHCRDPAACQHQLLRRLRARAADQPLLLLPRPAR